MRRRLTLAFVLVAGVSAAALALGSYLVVQENRLDDSVERALAQSRSNFLVADEILEATAGPATEEVLDALARRGDFVTVGISGQSPFSSSLSFSAADVPGDLRRTVAEGELGYQRETVRDDPFLVVGGRVAGSDLDLYFFFDESELFQDLSSLRTILLVGVGALGLLAGIVGSILARRTLAPVARASSAAHSLAEGLLETRLPVERADEFGLWAASFNEMAEALQSKIAALSEAQARERRFTSDVAHELRTPLTALVAEASLLAEELDRMPPGARRPAELLIEDVERMRRLVEDLMEISRLDAGAESVRVELVDLDEAVSASVRGRDPGGRVRVEGGGVTVETDRRRLERIVANLVGNALEHCEGSVEVRIGRDGGAALVEVSDEGPGISSEHLPYVFERFFKADPSRTSAGSGLGLAIARENARLLGGDIDVASTAGVGTRFTLRLPVTQPLRAGDGSVSKEDEDDRP
jgi:two-component system sensor histidine kinase MtrB